LRAHSIQELSHKLKYSEANFPNVFAVARDMVEVVRIKVQLTITQQQVPKTFYFLGKAIVLVRPT